jgi:GMP synthase (glutamine-hydrolysing)
VLDFGSQTSHLILRRLRGLNVYAEMLPCTTKLADLPFKPKGIILSGGEIWFEMGGGGSLDK